MKLGGTRPPGDNPLLLAISGTGSFICPVADEAGHTKAFDSIGSVAQVEFQNILK